MAAAEFEIEKKPTIGITERNLPFGRSTLNVRLGTCQVDMAARCRIRSAKFKFRDCGAKETLGHRYNFFLSLMF